jgi:dCTP deaminase
MIIEGIVGTLNDIQIKEFSNQGLLISKGFKSENVLQACYELRASNIYYDQSNGFERIDIIESNYDYILIKPKQSVIIITIEELKIPHNCLGRILTKGKLFSIGLLPINTYADPGFIGNLGIIFHNNSTDYLKIKKGEPIAKIEFSLFENPVETPYSGQHGYKTNIWPIPVEYKLTDIEFSKDTRINSVSREIEKIYGKKYAQVISRLLGVEKKLLLFAVLYFTFSLITISIIIYIGKEDLISYFLTILIGLISNVIVFLIGFNLEKKIKHD